MSLKRAMWRICLAFLCLAQVSSLKLEQLRPSLWSLAEVLRQDLTGDEGSARKTLEEKARKMEDDGTAGLLRQLARQGRNDAKVFSSSSSVSESHVSTDGQGHGYVLRHVKTCKNGVCEEHTEKSSPKNGTAGTENGTATSLTMPEKTSVEFSDALDREIGKLQEHMRNMERDIKVPDFNNIFAPVSEDFWNHFHSIPELSNQTESLSSESVSEETVLRNGHAVRRLRRCKNGHCHTTVEEGNSTKTATSVLDLDLP